MADPGRRPAVASRGSRGSPGLSPMPVVLAVAAILAVLTVVTLFRALGSGTTTPTPTTTVTVVKPATEDGASPTELPRPQWNTAVPHTT